MEQGPAKETPVTLVALVPGLLAMLSNFVAKQTLPAPVPFPTLFTHKS